MHMCDNHSEFDLNQIETEESHETKGQLKLSKIGNYDWNSLWRKMKINIPIKIIILCKDQKKGRNPKIKAFDSQLKSFHIKG